MPEIPGVPDIYGDFVQIATSELGIFLGIRAVKPLDSMPLEADDSEAQPEMPTELKAVVRFSQMQAKVFAIMLKRSLQEYEQQSGLIPLPPGFAEQVDLAADEW
jgi:hypothetical protein